MLGVVAGFLSLPASGPCLTDNSHTGVVVRSKLLVRDAIARPRKVHGTAWRIGPEDVLASSEQTNVEGCKQKYRL